MTYKYFLILNYLEGSALSVFLWESPRKRGVESVERFLRTLMRQPELRVIAGDNRREVLEGILRKYMERVA